MNIVQVVSIDGGAKTSKSTVCKSVAEALAKTKKVKTADAGGFIRRITAAALDIIGVVNNKHISDQELDEAITQVLADGTAFDDDYPWGDLERPLVGLWVSVVGKRPAVQQEKMRWFGVVIDQASASFDILVINGRNPRSHMTKWLDSGQIRLILELFTQCEPLVAARRQLLGHGIADPTEKQVKDTAQAIIDRRSLDLTRPTDTFIEPTVLVPFSLGDDPILAIEKTWEASKKEAPLPIGFDTTDMTKEGMIQAAQSLARASINRY